MLRAVAAALILAAAAAGCGGATASTEALHVARESGGADPSVTRIERVRLSNDDLMDVALVRAKYCASGTENGVSIPSGPNGSCGPNYAWFALTTDKHQVGPAAFLQHGSVEAVGAARASFSVLRTFPDIPNLLVRCEIPRGRSRGRTIAGLCQSNELGELHNGNRQVEFLEHWPLSKPQGSRKTAGWIVTLDPVGRMLSVHTAGQTPPQLSR